MKTLFSLIGIVVLASPAVWAQVPANSFAGLQPVLSVGQELRLRDDQGRTIRGKLVSVSGDELVIGRRRFLFRREERTFSEKSVNRVELMDSTWNGALIGGAAAFGLSVALFYGCNDRGDCLIYADLWPVYVAGGAALGEAIDNYYGKLVYEKRPQAGNVTVAPLIQRDGIGVLARVRF